MKLFIVNLLVSALASIFILQTLPESKNKNYLQKGTNNQLQQLKKQQGQRHKEEVDREIENYQELMDNDNASAFFFE